MTQRTTGTLRTRSEVMRRRRRDRQILVFGVAIIVLAAIAIAAASVYNGEAEGPFSAPFVSPAGEFESDVNLACPPPGSTPMSAGEVAVRVLNATDQSGLAGAVSTTLEGRGFVPVGVGNWSRDFEGTVRIMYGSEGLVQAYTLARHFNGAQLVLDTRENTTVDLVLGDEFETETTIRALLAPELQPDLLLAANAQCLPIDLIRAEPAPRTVPDDPFAVDPSATPTPSDDEEATEEADGDEPTD